MTPLDKSEFQNAITNKESFAAVMLPDEAVLRIFDTDSILLRPWPGCSGAEELPLQSDSQKNYLANLDQLIGQLNKQHRAKAVICRRICGSFDNPDFKAMAESYFESMPNSFRFFFREKGHTFWMGATPELLLDADGGTYRTRALAGTRPAGMNCPWDDKNIEEHNIVIDDIVERLKALGLEVHTGATETLKYSRIEHLCTAIEAHGPVGLADKIIETLHPTAAIAGYPRSAALEYIAEYEQFDRSYYAGLIGVPVSASRTLTYVILRTMAFDSRNWCIYTGSGITAQSVPEDEWLETAAKASPLLRTLEPYCSK